MASMRSHGGIIAAGLLLIAGLLPAAVLGQQCTEEVVGSSGLFGGAARPGALIVDHSALAESAGRIERVGLYFHKQSGCLRGVKAAFGSPPTPGIVGSTADANEHALKLESDEHFVRAAFKADKCVEYLKLTTNKDRSVSAGRAPADASQVQVSAPPADINAQLLAIKGVQAAGSGNNKGGMLQQLELVWGTTKCLGVQLKPESGTLDAAEASSSTSVAASAEGADPGACKPRLDMCNEKASMNAFTYCVWNAPFSGPKCRGGCCVSSGKCASSSCAIAGMGRDVPNMVCYGVNRGVGVGGNAACGGLACKLATPGCTTEPFGGNCVGTVVPFGAVDGVVPEARALIGAACLDATPSEDTLDASGNIARSISVGIYASKLWTVCDCSVGGVGLSDPASRLLNLTTSRIANFTKNEVLAAFSSILPQGDGSGEDDLDGETKRKPVTLLPSFAEMFKLPSLSGINLGLPGLLTGSGSGTATANGSLPAPKLPDVAGILQALKPAGGNAEVLKPEAAGVPKGAVGEFKMVAPGPAPAAVPASNTLGGLLKNFLKPLSGDGGSSSGASTHDAAGSSGSKPINLAELLGNLRKAGPSGAPPVSPATAPDAKKPDLSAIGSLIGKFIAGPNATPPPAAAAVPVAAGGAAASTVPAAATTTTATAPAATGSAQVPAKVQQQQSTPKPAPAAAPAPAPAAPAPPPARPAGPAVLTGAPVVRINTSPQQQAPPPAEPVPAAAGAASGHVAGDPKDRPLTLAQRLRQKKLAQQAGNATEESDATPAPASPPAVEAAPPPDPFRKRNGFSNMRNAAGQLGLFNQPSTRQLMPEVTAGVLGASTLSGPQPGQQLMPEQGTLAPDAAGAAAANMPELGALEALVGQLQAVQAAGGALPAGLDLNAIQAVLTQLKQGRGNAQDLTTLLAQVAAAVAQAAGGSGAAPAAAAAGATQAAYKQS